MFTNVLFSNKVTQLAANLSAEVSSVDEKEQRRVAYRLRLLLDLVAVVRCRIKIEEGRKQSQFCTLDRP